jgi:hypothetical protein
MKPRQKKSRKRSDASSTAARRLREAVFYVDESLYSKVLIRELRGAGANVEHVGGAFPFGAEDAIWLTGCGEEGWIVLTRDEKIRFRLLERVALEESGVGAFVFTVGAATGAETAATIGRLLAKFCNMAVSERRPFMYTFGLSGQLNRIKVRKQTRRRASKRAP